MKKIVFCHGFPFSKGFFKNLSEYFKEDFEMSYINLGYYGDKEQLKKKDYNDTFALGHGFGLTKLLELGYNFRGYIGISSFLEFTSSLANQRQISNLEYACNIDFIKAISGHVFRSGLPSLFRVDGINEQEVRKGIIELKNTNIRRLVKEINFPMLFLHGQKDIVFDVSEAKEQMGQYDLIINKHEGHGLGYFDAKWCYKHIKSFIEKN